MSLLSKVLSSRNPNAKCDDIAVVILRVFIGLTMAFAHGAAKMPPPGMFVDGVQALGFPAPLFFAWCATLAEFAGGLLLALGLFTRGAALFMFVTMFVAAFVAHAADPFQTKEMAFIYLFVSLFFVLFGAGRWSIDHMLSKRK